MVLSLCLHLSNPYSCHLIAAVDVINCGLEQFVYLGIACTYHSAHILFRYKFVLVILKLGV